MTTIMCDQGLRFIILIIVSLACFSYSTASKEVQTPRPNNDVSESSQEVTSLPLLSPELTEKILKALSKRYIHKHNDIAKIDQGIHDHNDDDLLSLDGVSLNRDYEEFHHGFSGSSHYESPRFSWNPVGEKENGLLKGMYIDFPERRIRSQDGKNTREKNLPKGKKRKAKALGQLLLNRVSNKYESDIQEDYGEDEEFDYSKGLNDQKMNWEDYQNEDGPSVMELVALNARHKNMRRNREQHHRSLN